MTWQLMTITGPELIKPLSPVPAQRFVARHALAKQQPLDAVDMTYPLGRQCFTLAGDTPPVFLLRRGNTNHRAHPWFAPLVRQKRTHQGFTIDFVGLSPTSAARGGNRGRVDNVAFNSFRFQSAMNPKPIKAGLLDHNDRKLLRRSGTRFRLKTP